jgi:hypothetical protein
MNARDSGKVVGTLVQTVCKHYRAEHKASDESDFRVIHLVATAVSHFKSKTLFSRRGASVP